MSKKRQINLDLSSAPCSQDQPGPEVQLPPSIEPNRLCIESLKGAKPRTRSRVFTTMACTIDFRCLDEGFGGKTYKRKRQSQCNEVNDADAPMDVDGGFPPAAKRSAVASSENPDKPTFGKPTYDGVIAGKVSGRKWKQPRKRRASAALVRKGPNFEERAREKEVKRAYRERKEELKEEIRRNKEEKRKLREERERRKKENILRSGTKLQKITNPKTLQRIAKSKEKKLLKVVPDDMINPNKKKQG